MAKVLRYPYVLIQLTVSSKAFRVGTRVKLNEQYLVATYLSGY